MDDFNGMNNEPNGVGAPDQTMGQEQPMSGTVENTNPAPNQFGQQPNQFGQQPYQFDNNNGGGQVPGKGMAIAAMVLGIVAIVFSCCCTYIGIICGIIAVVLGIMVKKQNREGDGMALAGIICGGIGALLGIIMTIINIIAMQNGNNAFQDLLNDLNAAVQFIIR